MIPVDGAPPTLAPNATPGGGASAKPEPDTGGGDAASGDVIELEAQDPFAWSVYEIEAAPGQVIRATNVGLLEHNFVVDELGIAEDLPSGEPVDITIPEDAPVGDEYFYYCSVPGHREGGMEGTLTIVEAGAAPAEGEGGEEAAAGGEEAAAGGAGEPIEIEAQDPFNWSIYEIEAAPGQVIRAVNAGLLEHDFTVDELEIHEVLTAEPVDITIPEDAPVGETFEFYCSVPGHREGGMEGTLTIIEAGGGEAAPAAGDGEATAAAGDGEAAAGPGAPIEIEAQDPFAWSIYEIEAAPGQVIRAVNAGLLEHDFTVDELEIHEVLTDEPVDITIPDDAPVGETFEFYCSVPGHREGGMEGTLTIVDAGGGGEAAAPAGGEGEPAAEVEPILLEAVDPFQWSIGEMTVAPGQVIQVVNTGLLEHDFVVDELEISEPLPIGDTIEVTVPVDAPVGETFEFYCSIPGHRASGMEGTITIAEAPAGPEEQGGPSEPIEVPPAEVEDEVAALMEEPGVIPLEATDPANWSWKAIEAAPGQTIRVLNLGVLEHDFVIDELGIKQELPFGEPQDVVVPEDVQIGDTYLYYCSIPGHRELGMEGTLTIVETPATPMASPQASPVASPVADAASGGGDVIELEAQDPFAWSVTEIEAAPGQVIRAVNTGMLEHDFTVDELDINEVLTDEPVEITIPEDAPVGDSYEFYCSVPGHREGGMVGTLTIV
jgi:uncharacterized cupredoxin-like copper-binding protein